MVLQCANGAGDLMARRSSAAYDIRIKGYRPPLAVLDRQELDVEHLELLRAEECRWTNLVQMQ